MIARSISSHIAHWQPASSKSPIIGIISVLVGSFIVTLNTRITAIGLADIRGAVHAGFDEGAWITTAYTVGQMLVCAPTVWAGLVYGPRQILLMASFVVVVTSFLIPFSTSLNEILLLQLLSGLAMGTFVPLTLSFVTRNLPPKFVTFGVAVYAMNAELSQNISASVEGFYLDSLSWKWIFWQNVILAAAMFALVWVGMPKRKPERVPAADIDLSGLIFYSLCFSFLYAMLDQGDRLDWFRNGLINGLALASVILFFAFVHNCYTAGRPWLNLRYIVRSNIGLLAVMLTFIRLATIAIAFLIPQYLTQIQGYRALQIGDVLLMIAAPQLILAPSIAVILRFADSRIMAAIGFWLIGLACIAVSGTLTPFWISDDFMPSQILQAIGQSFALTSLITYNLRFINPSEALAFGTILQTSRLMGGEIGFAFVQTFVRIREQLHSNLLGLHVSNGAGTVAHELARRTGNFLQFGVSEAQERGTYMISVAVQKQAYVLAYIDAFVLVGASMLLCLLLMLFLRAPPKTQ